VIVVIGCPTGRLDDGRVTAGGTASTVAIAAAGGGRQVQLVGRIGDDAHDDAGVRPSAASEGVRTLLLEAADVELGLRYLTDYRVIVLADQVAPEVVAVAVDAARWGAARLVVILEPGAAVPDPVPVDATVIEAPASDPDGAFAALVGRFAAALDEGTAPGDAFLGSLAAAGGTEATPG
jgi:hypothetical protein